MNKKDIYEHLADIYLDASVKKKNKKVKKYPDLFQNLFFISTLIIFALTIQLFNLYRNNKILFSALDNNKPIKSQLVFVLQSNPVKINFNFDPAKEEGYHINLNELDLARFKALGFSIRKANYDDKIIVKLEVTNAYGQKSEMYFHDIPSYKWQDHRVNFAEFKGVKDWSKMSNLSFVIEESNIKEKKGIVYLDNIRFLR